jgi:3-hydroxy acid dehydrogenase/malonic semialdehyde reductase
MRSYRQSLLSKRILVTGGTTGIGRETVALLASGGARVLTFGRNAPELQDALEYARAEGHEVFGFTADVGTREGLRTIFEEVDATLGGLDILVACAALGAQPVHEMTDEGWREVIDVNLVAYMACAREAMRRFEQNGGGHLLFVGSISAELKVAGESVYAATKAGVQAFAETLRKEVADKNIRVTVIQPGSVATDMQECSNREKHDAVANHEMLRAGEVAEAIEFALTRSERTDVVTLRIEPRIQTTA